MVFRKFYKSRAEQVMRPINVEITMGHNIGLSDCYYRPTDREVCDDYLKAVDLLTINSNEVSLKNQIQETKGRQSEQRVYNKRKASRKKKIK